MKKIITLFGLLAALVTGCAVPAAKPGTETKLQPKEFAAAKLEEFCEGLSPERCQQISMKFCAEMSPKERIKYVYNRLQEYGTKFEKVNGEKDPCGEEFFDRKEIVYNNGTKRTIKVVARKHTNTPACKDHKRQTDQKWQYLFCQGSNLSQFCEPVTNGFMSIIKEEEEEDKKFCVEWREYLLIKDVNDCRETSIHQMKIVSSKLTASVRIYPGVCGNYGDLNPCPDSDGLNRALVSVTLHCIKYRSMDEMNSK